MTDNAQPIARTRIEEIRQYVEHATDGDNYRDDLQFLLDLVAAQGRRIAALEQEPKEARELYEANHG